MKRERDGVGWGVGGRLREGGRERLKGRQTDRTHRDRDKNNKKEKKLLRE